MNATDTLAPGRTLSLYGQAWQLAADPERPGEVWSHQGHGSTVYKLESGPLSCAAKLVGADSGGAGLREVAGKLEMWAVVPGLLVAQRTVLDPARCRELLGASAGNTYAVLMPWVNGPSWDSVVLGRWEITPQQAVRIARGLAGAFAGLEDLGAAHCQITGRHVLLPVLGYHHDAVGPHARESQGVVAHPVALVDLERCCGPSMQAPPAPPFEVGGYRHRGGPAWSGLADRFAGAVLLAEVLGWCDPIVREAAAGGSFFAPQELQQDGRRYQLLLARLEARWGRAPASLLRQAWSSPSLAACPPLSAWLEAVPDAYRPAPRRARTVRPFPAVLAGSTGAPVALGTQPVPEEAVEEPLLSPDTRARRRGWWAVPAAMFLVAAAAAGTMAFWPGPPGSRAPEGPRFSAEAAVPARPAPVLPDVSQIRSPGLAEDEVWLRARDAFDAKRWTDSIQELRSLGLAGNDAPEIRSLLFAALVNRGDGFLDTGNTGLALADYRAAKEIDPEHPAVKERLEAPVPAAAAAVSGTPQSGTNTPTPLPGTPTAIPSPSSSPDTRAIAPLLANTPARTATPPPPPTAQPTPTITPIPPPPTFTPTPRPVVIIATPTPFPVTATPIEPPPTVTPTPRPPPPPPPTGLTALAQTCGRVLITWQYDVSANAAFRVYRGGVFAGGVGPGTRYFTDSRLEPDTQYRYTVSAWGPGGESAPSGAIEVRTQPWKEGCS